VNNTPNDPAPKGIGAWFLHKVATTPASWFGLAAGISIFFASISKMPPPGAIGFSVICGLGVTIFSHGMLRAIRSNYERAQRRAAAAAPAPAQPHDEVIRAALRQAGLDQEAAILRNLASDRDALREAASADADNKDLASTLNLVEAICQSATASADELLDLQRRASDPLLDLTADHEQQQARIRSDIRQAYQAVADTRSRLRRKGATTSTTGSTRSGAEQLRQLTEQLKNETDIADRVDQRMRDLTDPMLERMMEMDADVSPSPDLPPRERE